MVKNFAFKLLRANVVLNQTLEFDASTIISKGSVIKISSVGIVDRKLVFRFRDVHSGVSFEMDRMLIPCLMITSFNILMCRLLFDFY